MRQIGKFKGAPAEQFYLSQIASTHQSINQSMRNALKDRHLRIPAAGSTAKINFYPQVPQAIL
jgi:hypothetical protein